MKLRYTLLILTLTLMILGASADSADDPQILSFAIAPQGEQFSVIGKTGKFALIHNSTSKRVEFSISSKSSVRFTAAALSSNSQWLALGAEDGSILLYDDVPDLWEGRAISLEKLPDFTPVGHDYEVQAVAFSPDGKMLASGAADGSLKLLFLTTSTSKKQSSFSLADQPTGGIQAIVFSSDGKTLAAGTEDGAVTLWDIEKRRVKKRYDPHEESYDVTALAFSAVNEILAAGTSNSELTLWDISRHQRITTLEGHDGTVGAINALAFSTDGKLLVSGADDKKVMLWNTETRQRIGEYNRGSAVLSIAFTADGQTLIMGDKGGKIKHPAITDFHISPRAGEQDQVAQQTQPTPRKKSTTSRFHYITNERGVTKKQTQNNTQRTAKAKKQDSIPSKLYEEITPPKKSRLVHSVAFATSTDKPTYILGQQNYFLLTTAQRQHQSVKLPNLYPGSTVVSAAFSHTLKYALALSGEKGNLLLFYDSLDDKSPMIFNADSRVNDVTYSPDTYMLAVGTAEKVSTRNTKDGNLFINQIDIPGIAKSLAFSPNSQILAVGRAHGTIELWDVFEHTRLKSLKPKSNYGAKSLAFSPNGKMLAVGKVITGQIELWNVLSAQRQGSFTNQHHGTVNSVAFSPNGKTLASGAEDGKVLLWDIQTQEKIDPIQRFKQKHPKFNGTGHRENTQVLSVEFSDDGKTLMSGDETGLVLLWDLSTIDIDTGPSTDFIASKEQQDASKTTSQIGESNNQKNQGPRTTTTVEKPDKIKPEITVKPPGNVAAGKKVKMISGTVKGDRNGIQRVTIDDKEIGIALEAAFTYYFETTVRLEEEGDNTFTIAATDNEGRTSSEEFIIHRKPSPPIIEVISPQFTETRQDRVEIKVKVTDESGIAEVKCNNMPLRRLSAVSGGGIYIETFVFVLRGPTSFRITARDTKGSDEAIEQITITSLADETPTDETPPTIVISENKRAVGAEQHSTYISGTVKDADSGIKSVKIGDEEIPLPDSTGYFRHSVPLNEGDNTFTITATDEQDNPHTETVEIYRTPIPPKIKVISPQLDENNAAKIWQNSVEVQVEVTDESGIAEVRGYHNTVMQRDSPVSSGAIYSQTITYYDRGALAVKITAIDTKGAKAEEKITITYVVEDETPPTIVIPAKKREVSAAQTYISGTVKDADSNIGSVTISGIKIGDVEISPDSTGYFRHSVPLNEGDNTFTITATDEQDNPHTETVEIYRTPIPPDILVTAPSLDRNNAATISTDAFTVTVEVIDKSGVQRVKINGKVVRPAPDGKTFSTTLNRSNVSGRVIIEATDSVGTSDSKSFTVDFQQSQQPIGTTTPVSKLTPDDFRKTTTSSSEPTPTPASTTLNKANDEDKPVIQFVDNYDLIAGKPHKIREDTFHLVINVMDNSEIVGRVKIEHTLKDQTFFASKTDEKHRYEVHLPINEGENEFKIIAIDEWHNEGNASFKIERLPRDTDGPTIQFLQVGTQSVSYPGAVILVSKKEVTIQGSVIDASGIQGDTVTINGNPTKVERDGRFRKNLPLNYGENAIIVHAMDIHNYPSEFTFTITHRLDRTNKDFALFFPIKDYLGDKNRQWTDLIGPINDAQKVAENLRVNYGFATKIYPDLTKRTLINTLLKYRYNFNGTEYTEGSQLLIFFSGHGYLHDPDPNDDEEAKGYLITADTEWIDEDPSLSTGIKHAELRDDINKIKCPRILVLLDTCDSGMFDPSYDPPPTAKGPMDNLPTLEKAIEKLKLEARWCLTAGGVGKVLDGTETEHSPFAKAFLNALNTKGGEDSILDIEEIWKEIEKSKNNSMYDKAAEQWKEEYNFILEDPEPRKGRFGTTSVENSDFLLFPIE